MCLIIWNCRVLIILYVLNIIFPLLVLFLISSFNLLSPRFDFSAMPWRKMDFPSAKEIKARTNCFVAKTFYFWVYIIRTSLPISFCYHYQYKFKIWKYNVYELENTLQDSCFFLSTLQDSFKKALLRFYERPLPWKASSSRPRTWHLCHRKSHRIVALLLPRGLTRLLPRTSFRDEVLWGKPVPHHGEIGLDYSGAHDFIMSINLYCQLYLGKKKKTRWCCTKYYLAKAIRIVLVVRGLKPRCYHCTKKKFNWPTRTEAKIIKDRCHLEWTNN